MQSYTHYKILGLLLLCIGCVIASDAVYAGPVVPPTQAAPVVPAAAPTNCTLMTVAPNISDTTSSIYQTGLAIISSIFTSINAILADVSKDFYNNIIGNAQFQNAATAMVIAYLAIYGVMILFGLAPATGKEVVTRLIKIGIVWTLIGGVNGVDGWSYFSDYIGNFFIGGMNQLITQYATTGATVAFAPSLDNNATGALDPNAVSNMFVPLGMIMGQKFMVSIFSLASLCPYGFVMALALVLGLVEFIFMLVSVILTYIKSIVGLSFLFGIAPIFIITLLFGKSKHLFMGWLNQVVAFALTPVMLFAFLSFYLQLITTSIQNVLYPASAGTGGLDFCWVKWMTIWGSDIYWWRPYLPSNTNLPTQHDWHCATNAPPINITDILYFVILCYLGKSLSTFVEQMAQNISNGVTPGGGKMFSAIDTLKGMAGGQLQALASPASPAAPARPAPPPRRGWRW